MLVFFYKHSGDASVGKALSLSPNHKFQLEISEERERERESYPGNLIRQYKTAIGRDIMEGVRAALWPRGRWCAAAVDDKKKIKRKKIQLTKLK